MYTHTHIHSHTYDFHCPRTVFFLLVQVDQHEAHQGTLLHIPSVSEHVRHCAGGRKGVVGGATQQGSLSMLFPSFIHAMEADLFERDRLFERQPV